MRKLQAYLSHIECKKILDVGTGNGSFVKMITALTDSYDEIIGIDTLEKSIEDASKNFEDERVSFQVMDAYNTNFPDDYFDLVTFSNTLHHIEDIEGLFKEMERVCKEDGVILVNEMMKNGLTKRQKSHVLLHHFAAEVDRLNGEIHNETLKDVEILKLLEENSKRQIKDVWPLQMQRESENTQEEIDWLIGTIDKLIEQTKNSEHHSAFVKKGEKVKKHIKRNGFDSATQLAVILK